MKFINTFLFVVFTCFANNIYLIPSMQENYNICFNGNEFNIHRNEDCRWRLSLQWGILEKQGAFILYLNNESVGSFFYTKICARRNKKRSIKCFIRYIEIEDNFKGKKYSTFLIKHACQKLLQEGVISFFGYPLSGVEDLYSKLAKQNLLNIKFSECKIADDETKIKASCFVGMKTISNL